MKLSRHLQLRVFAVSDADGKGPAVAIEQWAVSASGRHYRFRKRIFLLPRHLEPVLAAIADAAVDLGNADRSETP